jgi:hypothetical protein
VIERNPDPATLIPIFAVITDTFRAHIDSSGLYSLAIHPIAEGAIRR